PVVGSIATDVIGFGSLIASRVGPVHDFGIMTSVGAVMVLVATALVVPFLALWGRFDTDPQRAWGEGVLELGLDGLVRRIVRHPGPILLGSTLLVAAAVAGMRWLEVETDFTRNFRRSSPVVASYDMIETRLGGAGVWDVLLPAGEAIDGKVLGDMARLEQRLRTEVTIPDRDGRAVPALTKVMSLADVMAAVSPISLERLQSTQLGSWLVTNAIDMIQKQVPQLSRTFIGRDPEDGSTWLRVMLRAHERQPAPQKRAIIEQVNRIVAEEFPARAGRPAGAVTGFFVLLSQLVDRMLSDQWLTFLLAAAGIFLLLAVSFRSLLVATVALVPNALPIFVVLGLLGWAGERINMGTAMIAAVSMGLSVDSSIHYLAAFRRRLAAGQPIAAALETAHQTAGRAMIFSTLLHARARNRISRAHHQRVHPHGVVRGTLLPHAHGGPAWQPRRPPRAALVAGPVAEPRLSHRHKHATFVPFVHRSQEPLMTHEFSHLRAGGAGGGIVADPAARPEAIEADAIVTFLTEGGIGSGAVAEIDRATGGLLSRLAAAGEITGKRYECVPILAAPGLKAGQLVVVGLGKREDLDAGVLYRAAATASKHLAGRPRSKVAFVADGSWTTRQTEQAVAGAAVGMVGQDLYRAEKKRTRFGSTVWLVAAAEAVAHGVVISEGVNLARRLVNMPPDDLYPQTFSEEAAAVAGRTGMEIEIWDEEQLARERCHAILAVGRGSNRAPRLVILH
ncbi:MAG: MMPL family transporter, partial [Planctomycetia bacterium]|nr:MMPL family transporter [Planctomycetia bacterium]